MGKPSAGIPKSLTPCSALVAMALLRVAALVDCDVCASAFVRYDASVACDALRLRLGDEYMTGVA